MKKVLVLIAVLAFPCFAHAFGVGENVNVEYNNGWYPAEVIGKGNSYGLVTHHVRYLQSGLTEWVAPNRIHSEGDNGPWVGADQYGGKFWVGKNVQVEFNGTWYPGQLLSKRKSFGVNTFQIKYIQSGLREWVAPNRVR